MKALNRFFHTLRWKTIFVFTIPLVVMVLISLIFAVLENYHVYSFKDNGGNTSGAFSLPAIRVSLNDQLKSLQIMLQTPDLSEESILPKYRLSIDNAQLDSLENNLPESAFRYVKGYLQYNNKMFRINVRYRGDNTWHWLYPKKSFRIKMKKEDILDGARLLNFVAPKSRPMIETALGNYLSAQMGVLTPKSYFIRLYLNNRYNGVYQSEEQIDESFLRAHNKLPGDIYYGEKGTYTKMWTDAYDWDKKAHVNSMPSENVSNLQELLDLVHNASDVEFMQKFPQLMNVEKYLAWHAVAELSGSKHQDYEHNHKLYADPSNGIFEPIQWDLFGHGAHTEFTRPIDYPLHPFADRVYRIPQYVERKNGMIWKALQTYSSTSNVHHVIDSLYTLIRNDVYADNLKSSPDFFETDWRNRPFTNEEFDEAIQRRKKWVEIRNEFLFKTLSDVRIGAEISPLQSSDFATDKLKAARISLRSGGVCGVKFYQLLLKVRDSGTLRPTLQLWRDRNFNGMFDEHDELISVGRTWSSNNNGNMIFDVGDELLPGRMKLNIQTDAAGMGYRLEPSPLVYTYFIVNQSRTTPLTFSAEDLTFMLHHDLNDSVITPVVKVSTVPVIAQTPASTISLHPWKVPKEPSGNTIVWEGKKVIQENITITEGDTLKILPGTNILLDSGICVVAYGKVFGLGTAERGITFSPLNEGKPWGTFALQGSATAGSVLRYCDFGGGSDKHFPRVYYSGMVEIRNTTATVDHCTIHDNTIGDDSFHAVFADLLIENSKFENGNSDAVDFDICRGTIRSCVFRSNKNDAIDLMGSTPLIENNYIEGSGDKGISVGEDSRPTIFNNVIVKCAIGIQAKDHSHPLIVNNVIMNNGIGLSAYKKNWRYGDGGHGIVSNSIVAGNTHKIDFDKHSSYSISNSLLDTAWEGEKIYHTPISFEQLQNNNFIVPSFFTEIINAGSLEAIKRVKLEYSKQTAPIGLVEPLQQNIFKTAPVSLNSHLHNFPRRTVR